MRRILTLSVFLLVFISGLGPLSSCKIAAANTRNQVGLEVDHGYWISTTEDVVPNIPMSRFNQWIFQMSNWQDGAGQPVVNPSITVLASQQFVGFSPSQPTISNGEYQWNFCLEIPETFALGVSANEANSIDYGRPGFTAERHVFPETLADPVTIQNVSLTLTLEDPLPVDVNEFDIDIAPGNFVFQQKQLVNYTVLSTNNVEDWSAWSGGWSAIPSNIVLGKTYHFMATFKAVKSPDLQGSPIVKPGILIHLAHWGRLNSVTIGSSATVVHPEGPTVTFSGIGEYEWHADVSYSRQDFWFSQVVSEVIENPEPPPPYIVRIPATLDIRPDSYNLGRRADFVTAYIELPKGYSIRDINVSTLLLTGAVRAKLKPTAIGDYDKDGILDLMVKFEVTTARAIADVTKLINDKFFDVTVTVTGKLYDGTLFQGSDTVEIIMPRWLRLVELY